jgi:transposase
VYTLIDPVGTILGARRFPAAGAGMARAIGWIGASTGRDMRVLWVVEGCASYGAALAVMLKAAGYQVAEAPCYAKQGGRGKSDELDSARMARAALGLEEGELREPRSQEDERAALQIPLTARRDMTGERTRHVNALTALLRAHDLGVDARKAPSAAQISAIGRWRRRGAPLPLATARGEAIRLARRVSALDGQIEANLQAIDALVRQGPAASLLEERGYGPVSAAACLAAWSHPGRVRSEAAFAALAGACPIPVSSGNTCRHRLNRGGDRQLNKALHMIALSRMSFDPATRQYVERQRAKGKTDREIRRILKRYIARHVYRTLSHNTTHPIDKP